MSEVCCACKRWERSFERIKAAQIIAHLHGYQYNGDTFIYCPWCGEALKDKVDAKELSPV